MILPVKCEGDFAYWSGLNALWSTDETIINVEHDMEFSDELVDGLLDCPHPLCAYAYSVYPTKLGRFIYCATTDGPGVGHPPRWIEGPADEWAAWSSIGFCKISPEVRTKPLDKMFWQYLEHCINRVACGVTREGSRAVRHMWHIHWPEVKHFHDYDRIPDHLW